MAAAHGHQVTVLEKDDHVGGHAHLQSLLPGRGEYRRIGTWLGDQAAKNGAKINLSTAVVPDEIGSVLREFEPDHVVVATRSRVRSDGFQGWTGEALPGWESARCVGWDDVATGRVSPSGRVLVIDDTSDLIAPLVASMLAARGVETTIVTRWPMLAIENWTTSTSSG